jgi:Domain of unknown function (DUF4129)
MNRGASRIQLAVIVLGVLVLVGVVAVASSGSTSAGSGETRAPGDILLDTFFSLGLLALVPAAALFVYGLMQRKEIAREIASGRYRRTGVAAYLVFAGLFAIAVYFRLRSGLTFGGAQDELVDPGETRPAGAPTTDPPTGRTYEAEFAWIPVLVVVALVATGVGAYFLAARRRRRLLGPTDERAAEQVADALEDTLDDLRAEPDARRAVIAAYARLERALAATGLPRWRTETAAEYVGRILERLEVDGAPVRTLTDLFTRAKFSQHDVDATMKETAIDALVQIRDELRAAAHRREDEQRQALTAPEQAVPS